MANETDQHSASFFCLMTFFLVFETDFYGSTDWSTFPPKENHFCADPARLRELYKEQKSVPGYKKLLKKNITVFGTFDGRCQEDRA